MAEPARDDGAPGVIRSAFGLLELLPRVLGRARPADLTKHSGLPRTTVHRLIGQLAAIGAVERIDAHYRLDPNLLILGQHMTPLDRLRAVPQRPLIELAAASPAHVRLIAMAGTGPIYLDVCVGRVGCRSVVSRAHRHPWDRPGRACCSPAGRHSPSTTDVRSTV